MSNAFPNIQRIIDSSSSLALTRWKSLLEECARDLDEQNADRLVIEYRGLISECVSHSNALLHAISQLVQLAGKELADSPNEAVVVIKAPPDSAPFNQSMLESGTVRAVSECEWPRAVTVTALPSNQVRVLVQSTADIKEGGYCEHIGNYISNPKYSDRKMPEYAAWCAGNSAFRLQTTRRQDPLFFEGVAISLESCGLFRLAAQAWKEAESFSIGQIRRDRYQRQANNSVRLEQQVTEGKPSDESVLINDVFYRCGPQPLQIPISSCL